MLRKLIVLLLIMLPISIQAQFPNLEESANFPAPDKGWLKMIQLKNGNTMLLNIEFGSHQINVKIFDKSRILVGDKLLSPNISVKNKFTYDNSQVKGFFVVKDNVVLFIGNIIDRKLTVSRVIIDGKNGEMLSEAVIATFDQYPRTAGYAIEYGEKSINYFVVKKDPNSDSYGICLVHGFSGVVNSKIEFIHYSPEHLQISRHFITTTKTDITRVGYLDMVVVGTSKLIGFAQFRNKDEKSQNTISMISLENGNSSPLYLKEIVVDKELTLKNFIIKYDKNSGDFLLLMMSYLKKSSEYVPQLLRLNAKNMEIISTINIIQSESVYQKFKDYFSKNKYQPSEVSLIEFNRGKNKYNGLPEDFIINNDNTYTIIFEEMTNVSTQSGGYYTALYNASVVIYDAKFTEIESYFIPENHAVYGTEVLYMKDAGNNPKMNLGINIYSGLACYQHNKQKYLWINEKIGSSTAQMDRIDNCEAFIYTLVNNIETKQSVFKKTQSKSENGPILSTSLSDFNSETGVLAMIKYDLNIKKSFKIVWIKL